MLSYAGEQSLVQLLMAVGDGERGIEMARQLLCRNTEFDLISAFERFDRSMKSYVSSLDIVQFLNDNSVYTVSK